MATIEQEVVRNFCPKCMTENKPRNCTLYCLKCGNSDLIPKPEEFISFTEEELDLIIGAIPLQALPEPPKLPKARIGQISEIAEFKEIEEENSAPQIDPEIYEKLQQPFAFVTGKAGSGKSTTIRLMAELDLKYIELTSTTGISAINLGGRTINSVLKYFNTKSLENIYRDGRLQWVLRKIRSTKRVLGIEEISMMAAEQLDLICAAVDEINNDRTGKELGIHIIGDLCQLPVVEGNPPFKADSWNRFEKNTIHLTKIWRQDNQDFVKAMNYARSGDGNSCVAQLIDCGVRFTSEIDNYFDGTTLISLNVGVDAFNEQRLRQLTAPMIRVNSIRKGLQLKEWEKLIPAELRFKIGAYVMILNNDLPTFNFVNGDCGYIRKYDKISDKFDVELVRNGKIVRIGRILRENLSDKRQLSPGFAPYSDRKGTGDWCVGNISYHPLRLAWASSIHKAQGLSLDKVQIDTRANFFSAPAMGYVSLSRARTSEGLILVGNPSEIAKKINTSKEVLKWI